jgi:cytochrome c
MDTMTITKISAGLLGAWLVLLLGKWAGEEVYHASLHGEASYVIEVAGAEPEEEVAEVPFEERMAAASAENGAKVFRKCTACHKVGDGENAVGPHMYGVVGRDVGGLASYEYSGALSEQADVWTPENLYAFLEKPATWAPGTTMGFAGLAKSEDRADVIAYLDSLDD